MKNMKAVFYHRYGGPEVLEVKETTLPAVGEFDILIKNQASSLTAADTFIRKGEPCFGRLFLGLTKPKNPMTGTGFSGQVVQAGAKVTQFKVGDRVFGETTLGFGANAEYVSVNAKDGIVQILPEKLSFEEGAVLCDGTLTSYNFLMDMAQLKKHHHILINGASGALGTAAIQLAKNVGAKVTAVCSGKNESLVRSLGADEVIDYQKEDFVQRPVQYDVIYDAVGKLKYAHCKKALKRSGQYLTPVLALGVLFSMIRTSMIGKKKVKFQATGLKKPAELNSFLVQIKPLLEKGKAVPVIDRTYSLNEIQEAHKYLDSGRKRGNTVLVYSD